MFNQDPVVTLADGSRVLAWVRADRTAVVAKLTDGVWSDQTTITGLPGNPLSPDFPHLMEGDGHNVLALARDGDGYLHIVGNQHNKALRYIRSTSPDDVTSWTTGSMTGSLETSMTYPQFVTLLDGRLLFFYRDGGSGNGDTILNVYDPNTQVWTQVGKVIDGRASSESPYLQHVGVDRTTGRVHLFWCFRPTTGGAGAAVDLSYAYCDPADLTAWFRSDGTAYTLPITHATAEIILATPVNSGLINQGGAEVDSTGRPHVAVTQFDGSGNLQIVHMWHDGTWQSQQVTAWTHPMNVVTGALDGSIARPAVATTSTGKVFIVGRNEVDLPGKIVAFEVTPGQAVRQVELVDGATADWEPTFDTGAMRDEDRLVMPVVPLIDDNTSQVPTAAWWANQTGALYEVDLDSL